MRDDAARGGGLKFLQKDENPTIFLPVFLEHNGGLDPGVICWSLTSGPAPSGNTSLTLNNTTMLRCDNTGAVLGLRLRWN